MLTIVDYGMGNLRSIHKKLEMLKIQSRISSRPVDILSASHLILPGVGFFKAGMENLKARELDTAIVNAVNQKNIPLLGICLGMQLLTDHSEEGNSEGLGIIPAKVVKFSFDQTDNKLRTPHVGWNTLNISKPCPLLKGIPTDNRYYFTHSYHVQCTNPENSFAQTEYGNTFDTIIGRGDTWGTQFHPEKSHRMGLNIIDNFVRSNP